MSRQKFVIGRSKCGQVAVLQGDGHGKTIFVMDGLSLDSHEELRWDDTWIRARNFVLEWSAGEREEVEQLARDYLHPPAGLK